MGIYRNRFWSDSFFSGCSDSATPSNLDSTTSSINANSVPNTTINNSTPSTLQKNSKTYNPSTFKGYACTDDCSGHEAGYNWAEEKGISDPYECGGNSASFIEGCESYAQEQQDELESENSDYEDTDYTY